MVRNDEIFYYYRYSEGDSHIHFTWKGNDSINFSSYTVFLGEFDTNIDKFGMLDWSKKVPSNFNKFPFYSYIYTNGKAFFYTSDKKKTFIYDSLGFISKELCFQIDSNRMSDNNLMLGCQITPLHNRRISNHVFSLFKRQLLIINKRAYDSTRVDISMYNFDSAFVEYYAFNRDYGYIPLNDTLELNQLNFSKSISK